MARLSLVGRCWELELYPNAMGNHQRVLKEVSKGWELGDEIQILLYLKIFNF